MLIYYLYKKTHNITDLKYLGRTTQNPFTYKGSGIYWKNHLKIHGINIRTDIIGIYNTLKELKEAGIYYSKLWNIVDDKQWANLISEEGFGAASGEDSIAHRPEIKEKARQRFLDNNPMKRPEIVSKFMGKNNPMKNLEIAAKCGGKKAKDYSFINPQGELIQVHNLHKFCRENKLDQRNMNAVNKGKTKSHRGWKCGGNNV